jgi:hypothetical protein
MASWGTLVLLAIVGVTTSILYTSIFTPSSIPGEGTNGVSSIFDFTVNSIDDGSPTNLAEYKGKKAYLVVNVASKCGLTDRNYAELQDLYEKLR